MARTTRRGASLTKNLIDGAVRLSLGIAAVAILLIILLGFLLDKFPVWQTITFAIIGAVLQTAILGLIYEVFLRSKVEDATLEKLGTARDVREHGLVKLNREATIEWSNVLEGTTKLCLVSSDPKRILGAADDLVVRRAKEGYLRQLTIVVPEDEWSNVEIWLKAFRDRWQRTAPGTEFFAVRADRRTTFELIASDSQYIVLLPALIESPGLERSKLLQFEKSEEWGIGSWLSRQTADLLTSSPVLGWSLPRDMNAADDLHASPTETVEREELT